MCQAEIESRVELEKRLKQAEEALQNLEKGLNSMERTKERDEQMKGDVTQLRSEQKFSFSQFVGGNIISVVIWRPPLDRVCITSGLERNTITFIDACFISEGSITGKKIRRKLVRSVINHLVTMW